MKFFARIIPVGAKLNQNSLFGLFSKERERAREREREREGERERGREGERERESQNNIHSYLLVSASAGSALSQFACLSFA